LTSVALVFNTLGGGISAVFVVPIGVALALVLWRRRWAALYFLIATVLGSVIVHLVKALLGRARPTDILVTADAGSFPSGHSANAAVLAATLGVIFARTWVWVVGVVYTVAMMLSRTYLGAHWISDTIGGALIGLGVAVIVWAPLAAKLYHERWAPHPPIWSKRAAH
jgi:undecaprenyl-diphosphatase